MSRFRGSFTLVLPSKATLSPQLPNRATQGPPNGSQSAPIGTQNRSQSVSNGANWRAEKVADVAPTYLQPFLSHLGSPFDTQSRPNGANVAPKDTVLAPNAAQSVPCGRGTGTRTLPVQKRIFTLLCEAVPDPWPAFFSRKAAILGVVPPVSSSAFAAEFLTFSKRLPMQAGMAALTTWGNSWCTSERFHEELILPCVLGCNGKDELAHYLECEFLWTLLEASTESRTSELHLCKTKRTRLTKPSRNSTLKLLVAFLAYHAMRMQYRDELHRAVREGNFGNVLEIFVCLVKHFWNTRNG